MRDSNALKIETVRALEYKILEGETWIYGKKKV